MHTEPFRLWENGAKERYSFFLLFILAFAVRLYAAFQTPVIAKDSILYMDNAIHLLSGDIVKGLNYFPPGYPVLIAIFYKIIGNPELAARVVSVIMGTLILLPFYCLTKEIFGKSIATVASMLFVFQPFLVQLGGEAISDSTYIFFFISSILMAWKALRNERLVFHLSFGILAAFAYLTRPEGIGLIFGFMVWFFIHFWLKGKRPALSFYGRFFTLLLVFFLLVAPYLYQVRQIAGEWRLNAKTNMIEFTGFQKVIEAKENISQLPDLKKEESPSNQNIIQKPSRLYAFLEFCSQYLKRLFLSAVKFTGIFHQLLFILFLSLLIMRKFFSYNFEGELFLAFFFLFYLFGAALFYVDGRHLLQLVLLSLPWAAAGLIGLSRQPMVTNATLYLKKWGWKWSSQTLLILLTIGILSPKTLAGHRQEKLALKESAIWIKSQKITSPVILSTDNRIAYYAQGRHIQLNQIEEMTTLVLKNRPDFVVIEMNKIGEIDKEVLSSLKPYSLKETFRAQNKKGSSDVTVYVLLGT